MGGGEQTVFIGNMTPIVVNRCHVNKIQFVTCAGLWEKLSNQPHERQMRFEQTFAGRQDRHRSGAWCCSFFFGRQ